MSSPYLPTWATAQEASEWLQAETGQLWTLPRLLETVHKMCVWIDCRGDEPAHVLEGLFQGRPEGFMAPVIFGSDIARLAFVRDGGTLHISRLPDGTLVKFDPPIRFPIEELRFDASSVRSVATRSVQPMEPPKDAQPARSGIGPAISTDDLCEGFDGVKFTSPQWRQKIAKGAPDWLQACRASPGNGGASANQPTWYAIDVAIALRAGKPRGAAVSMAKINSAFNTREALRPCREAWTQHRKDNPLLGE